MSIGKVADVYISKHIHIEVYTGFSQVVIVYIYILGTEVSMIVCL